MTDFHHSTAPCRHVLPPHRLRSDSAQGTMNMNPKTTRTILVTGIRAMARASIAIAPLDRDGETEFEGGDAELTVVKLLAGSAVV
jgi:hypothetical protein